MLLHVALLWHDKTDKEHSSMSTIALKNICHVKITYEKLVKKTSQDSMNNFVPVQFTPFPENPLLHVHWKDPPMLLHVASLEHGDVSHSFMSILAIKTLLKSNVCIRNYSGKYYVIIHIIHQLNIFTISSYLCKLFHFLKIHCYMYIERIHQCCCMLHRWNMVMKHTHLCLC